MKAVSQKSYLVALRNAMLCHYGGREIALTLEDVRSVFEEGGKRGRTEREIAEELGTPGEFVRALAAEGGVPSRKLPLLKAAEMLALCAFLVYLVLLENHMLASSDPWNTNLAFCIASVCVPVLVYFLAGATSLYCVDPRGAGAKRTYFACLTASVLLAGYEQLVLAWSCVSVQAPVAESDSVIRVLLAAGLVLLLVFAVGLFCGYGVCMGLFSILFGSVAGSAVWCDYAGRMDATPGCPLAYICVFPCLIGILTAYCLNRVGRSRP